MPGNVLVGSVLVIFAAIISFSALKSFTVPYLWISLTWVVVILCAIVLVPRYRSLWIKFIVLVSIFAGLEAYFWISENWVFTQIKSEGTFRWAEHDLLGYTAHKGVSHREAKFYRDKKMYDVVYTMDAYGHRITPPYKLNRTSNKQCILFFGDSNTFGLGLNDQDTLPYRVGIRSGAGYDVYNLSFMTHGPHQMLMMLERDMINPTVNCSPGEIKYVIYQTTADHVRRAAGLRDKVDLHRGPQYVLQENGGVTYQGQIGEDRSTAEKIERQLSKSYLYRKLVGGNAMYSRAYNSEDVELYLAIVGSARTRVKSQYPESEFHVLVWGNDTYDKNKVLLKQVLAGLTEKGISLHRINDILPGSDDNKPEYFIIEFDPHPNAAANDRIAKYIVEKILKK